MALLAQYSALQMLDLITTLVFLSAGVQEGNPIVALAMQLAQNPIGGLLLTKLVALAIGIYCWRTGRSKLLRRVNWMFTGLVTWNFVAICVAGGQIS